MWGAVVRGSDRSMTTTLNLLRTAVFDDFVARNPNATDPELTAWADWINVATGRGSPGRLAAVGTELSTILFAPRFAISRFQVPMALFKHWQEPRVRREIAKDYAATMTVGLTALALAALAGASVSLDPREPDFGKIRTGDTRLDIWGGMLQPARLMARLMLGATDRMGVTGQELSESEIAVDPLALLGQFATFKLSPIVTVPVELYRGRDVVGQPHTPPQTALNAIVPIVLRDVLDAYRSQDPARTAALGAFSLLGLGVSTYGERERHGASGRLSRVRRPGTGRPGTR